MGKSAHGDGQEPRFTSGMEEISPDYGNEDKEKQRMAKIRPLLKVSRNSNWPIGLSMTSGSSEPRSRSLISARLARKANHATGRIQLCGGLVATFSISSPGFFSGGREGTLLRTPLKSAAAPSVMPACPSMSIQCHLSHDDSPTDCE